MQKYKTYCEKIPKTFRKYEDSFSNKPIGGLWGCRGNEWKEWCESEEFALNRLKKCFYWRLKRGTKVLRIKTVKDYINLCLKYGNPNMFSVDYGLVAKDYDAVELVGDIVYKLRFGIYMSFYSKSLKRYGKKYADHKNKNVLSMGLSAWDVPSICVLNTSKVVRCK